MFTNKGLVKYAQSMLDYGSPYWYGTYGNTATEKLYQEKKRQYPSNYPPQKWTYESFKTQFGRKVHDCIGLVKRYLMNPTIGEDGYVRDPLATSKYNAKYDISANMLEAQAKEKGAISTIPEIVGLIVWKSGHVGIYIGNGWVIEERGHSYGTVKTKLSERPWVKWIKHPDITYVTDTPKGDTCMIELPVLKKGDKNETVKSLQILLNGKQYFDKDGIPLSVDGSFGGKTEYAVKKFQTKNGLTSDGVVGKATWNKLMKG